MLFPRVLEKLAQKINISKNICFVLFIKTMIVLYCFVYDQRFMSVSKLGLYNIKLKIMGTQCATLSPKPKPLSSPLATQPDWARCSEELQLQLMIQNLKVFDLTEVISLIKFECQGCFCILFKQSDSTIHQKMVEWKDSQKKTIVLSGELLEKHHLKITIYDKREKIMGKLEFDFHHLITGPFHQDHLLLERRARIAFDIKIVQKIKVNVKIADMKLNIDNVSDTDIENYGYILALTTSENDRGYSSQKVHFKPQLIQHSQLNVCIPSDDLKQANIKISLLKRYEDNVDQIFGSICIPLRKILKHIFKSYQQDRKTMEKRQLTFKQQVFLQGKNAGQVELSLIFINSKVYVEQMECLVSSENGIGTLSPQQINKTDGNIKLTELKQQLEGLKKFQSFKLKDKSEVKTKLKKIAEMTKKNVKISYTSHKELFQLQMTFLQILKDTSKMLRQGQDIINQHIWIVIDTVIHREELTIRFINLYPDINDKKAIGSKFYSFIMHLLQKVIKSTTVGITFHELKCIQKFIAFTYFRFPWLQKVLTRALKKKNDPQIDFDKLSQYGACMSTKSPAKTFVYDWDLSVYQLVKSEIQVMNSIENLEDLTLQIPDWDKYLFNRQNDDLFYGLLIEIWSEAQSILAYQNKTRWQYFPCYGELLSCFLGEMNQNKIVDFSNQFTKCSLKIISNELLLNSFMMLLFPKTCLYEIYCVLKCLDLIGSYFQTLVKANKKLPPEFNFNYFYTGVKSIIESNHSYLLTKVLILIYKYFKLFPVDLQSMLTNYFYKEFYRLFLHWCGYVRKIFCILVEHRIRKNIQHNPEESKLYFETQISESSDSVDRFKNLLDKIIKQGQKIEEESHINNENKRCKLPYHQQMKYKLKDRRKKMRDRKQSQENMMRKSEHISLSLSANNARERRYSLQNQLIPTIQIPQRLKQYIKQGIADYKQNCSIANPDKKIAEFQSLFYKGMTDNGGI